MNNHTLGWYRRTRLTLANRLALPLHHFFNRFPHYESGLSSVEISRIECRHPALTGRRAVQLSDLHLDRYQPRHDTLLSAVAALRPNWIFITGDLLTVPDGLPHLFRFLSGLRRLAPVYLTTEDNGGFRTFGPFGCLTAARAGSTASTTGTVTGCTSTAGSAGPGSRSDWPAPRKSSSLTGSDRNE